MSASTYVPPPAPQHQCTNAACGCNDLVTGGPCTEWCSANGVEAIDVQHGKAGLAACGCGHGSCRSNMPADTGEISTSTERGSG